MNKTILITGASTGIGKAGALELGRRGWKVFVHARSESRGNPVLDELKQSAPNANFVLVTGDVSSMAEVKLLAEQVKAQTPLFALVTDRRPWLEANFKETDLTHVTAGPVSYTHLTLPTSDLV